MTLERVCAPATVGGVAGTCLLAARIMAGLSVALLDVFDAVRFTRVVVSGVVPGVVPDGPAGEPSPRRLRLNSRCLREKSAVSFAVTKSPDSDDVFDLLLLRLRIHFPSPNNGRNVRELGCFGGFDADTGAGVDGAVLGASLECVCLADEEFELPLADRSLEFSLTADESTVVWSSVSELDTLRCRLSMRCA